MNSQETPKPTESVLVVDDDPIFCELLVSDLMLRGVKIFSAFAIEDAREVIKKHHFDVVILDNHLPDGQGTDLLPDLQQMELSLLCNRAIVLVICAGWMLVLGKIVFTVFPDGNHLLIPAVRFLAVQIALSKMEIHYSNTMLR